MIFIRDNIHYEVLRSAPVAFSMAKSLWERECISQDICSVCLNSLSWVFLISKDTSYSWVNASLKLTGICSSILVSALSAKSILRFSSLAISLCVREIFPNTSNSQFILSLR
eukprot:TRINITY_DN21754_c0_g1_i3.p1 TRINITY_DN21754_c0_g1~~TRINITY_DN21754_c0_g1_i3.p1  ORF type:complete len:112 (-),score=3.40 TRINITY_DN21754_c0_g1_i3:41-376(-)